MEVDMEGGEDDGMVEVMRMFTSLTNALFTSLEHAAEGFEQLLLNILNLTGKYMDILVPRPGVYKCPETYYKAFNTWLLGRMFYISSVGNLSRIHPLSMEVQLRVIHTLCVKEASFYSQLHLQYCSILEQLLLYYQENAHAHTPTTLPLYYFTPDKINIPTDKLDLEPMYVRVTGLQQCCSIIELVLRLLGDSIPLHADDMHRSHYEKFFQKILHAFVHYNASVKLAILSFFVKLIGNYDRVAMGKFSDAFPNVCGTLIVSTESLVSSLQDYCDNGDVDVEALKKFNFEIAELLELSEDYLRRTNSDLLRSVCTLVSCSRKNPKTYSKKLKSTCLKLAADLDVSAECVHLQSLSASEVDLVSHHYEQKLMAALKINPEQILPHVKENFYFQQLLNQMLDILTALDDRELDYYVVSCHLLKCDAILRVLQRIQISYDLWTKQNNLQRNRVFNEAIPPEQSRLILITLKTVYKTHYSKMKTDTKCISTILDMITGMAILLKTLNIVEYCQLLQLLQQNERTLSSESSVLVKDVQMLVLKYLLVKNVFPVNMFKDPSKEYMTHLFNSLSQDKTANGLVHIMELAPLLIINEYTTENKLIGEYLLPAFLTKQSEIKKNLPRTICALACMAFDDFVVSLNTPEDTSTGHIIFENKAIQVKLVCFKCHNEDRAKKTPDEFLTQYTKRNIIIYKSKQQKAQSSVSSGQRILFEKFLNVGNYGVLDNKDLFYLLKCFSNHTIFSEVTANSIITEKPIEVVAQIVRPFLTNVLLDVNTEESKKEAIMNVCIDRLVHCTRNSLESNDYNQQKYTLECIKEFGLSRNAKVLLPSTKLLVYFIMQPQCAFADKAVMYLKEVCDEHGYTTNQAYHRYKKDYCRLFVDCSVDSVQHFAPSILKVLRAFGFTGLVDFISKDVHHFLPYLIPFAVKVPHVPTMIEEIASLVQCSSSEFLSERFPHVYTHIYLYESDLVAKKSFDLIEKITGTKILKLIINHHRVILMDLLLQYCCNPEKVLKACRYLARHDPDTSGDTLDQSLSLSQIADFLHPRFLGVLAYFDNKLVNARVALSVKRKALQSFPDIVKLMGSKYLTPLRFKVLATLRSTLSLAKEFPKMLAQAWSAFIHNIDSVSLGPLLPNLAVSLLQQLPYAPAEINKIFQYLVLSNENLLSTHISDLFFLEDTKVLERVKMVIRKHVKRTQPKEFLEKVTWYLRHLSQDIPDVKLYVFTCLDKLLKENRQEIHKAVFSRNNIDPVMVQLLECLKTGCGDADGRVRLASGACLGQLGALETGLLPRQYVPPDRSPFAFSISDDCFASTALLELTRAFQYEKDTKVYYFNFFIVGLQKIMDNYALTIQEILKVYGISPSGSKKEVWDSFPEHMHQIMQPLLSSRYFLAFPAQPKKTHPLFGSAHAASFIEWAYNWAGQLIPLMESESVQELLRSVYPSMKRDVRTLLLFLPYMLLHAVMAPAHHDYIYQEMIHVVGTDSAISQSRGANESNPYRLLDSIGGAHEVTSNQTEDSNQVQLKCCKTVYMLLDFLNRWMLEWCHSKHHPTQNDNYKSVKQFVEKWDKLSVSRGNLACGQLERALQQLELYMLEGRERMQAQLPFLAGIYASLDEPDAVAGILTVKRSEPSLKELVLAHEVTGRVQDAAFCYERLAQDAPLDRHSLQGMVACYLSLDQPFTAYRLLSERDDEDVSLATLAAEPLWRLGRWEQLDELLDKPASKCTDNWGLLFGRILVSYRGGSREDFDSSWRDGVSRLLTQLEGGAARGGAGAGLENMLNLHIVTEARHAEETLHRLRALPDGAHECASLSRELLECWRLRACLVQSDVRTLEPLLRCRRILLQQTQKLLEPTHPRTANELRSHIGELWLQSAKHARKAGIFQQAYTYILNAEQYGPPRLFIEKARMYWARGQHEPAFTTLRRGLDEGPAHIDQLTVHQRQICAKARLLIATYNEETTNVDVDVNLQHYKEAVDVYRQWEKSLVCLGAYYEKVSGADESDGRSSSRRLHALNSYGRALQHGHKYLYQSMPRMLSIWLEFDVSPEGGSLAELSEMTEVIRTYSERLPLYLFLTAFSQIVSRICHPVKEVYQQIKAIIVRLMVAYPQHTLWMLMCVMKSSYPQRHKRCQDVLADARLKEPHILKFIYDFTQLAEKLIDLCNKPITNNTLQRKSETQTASVRALVATLPRLLAAAGFSPIMMPFQQFCRIVLPSKAATQEERVSFNVVSEPLVYISGIEDLITILPSLQHPRKVTLTGSDGKSYIIMLKPKDDLRKDFRLMEFNGVVNRLLQEGAETRRRRLYIRTYSVLPLNEECGLIEWVPNLLGLRPILLHLYKQKGILTNNRELKEMMCSSKDPLSRKLKVFQEELLPRHPPVFAEWYRRVFADPYGWYQARSAYIRTTAVMSMVGYILGLGDRHGENILFDSTNGDAVHVDFNCLFNKGEGFEWPERVPFRLTHNMQTAMGPLGHEGMYRKCCEATMRELRAQTAALMSVIGPFVYDPLVTWSRARALADCASGERVNQQARQHLAHIRQRLNGMVRTKNKQLSVSLSPEGQVEHLIAEATSVDNLCQMYLGWGPFL